MKYTSALSSLKSLLLSLLATIFIVTSANAQSLIHLSDATGISISASEEAELQRAADSLIAAFPVAFQDSFKVYDCGLYLQQEHYQGGYPEVFGKLVEEAQSKSKYYFILGRSIGSSTKIFVTLKLPTSGKFSCSNPLERELEQVDFKFYADSLLNSNNALNTLTKVEELTIAYVTANIKAHTECCDPGRSACNECMSHTLINTYFQSVGFNGYMGHDTILAPPVINLNPNVKDYSGFALRFMAKPYYGSYLYFAQNYSDLCDAYKDILPKQKIIITTNICNEADRQHFEEAKELMADTSYNYKGWIHIEHVADSSFNMYYNIEQKYTEASKIPTLYYSISKSEAPKLEKYSTESIKKIVGGIFSKNNMSYLHYNESIPDLTRSRVNLEWNPEFMQSWPIKRLGYTDASGSDVRGIQIYKYLFNNTKYGAGGDYYFPEGVYAGLTNKLLIQNYYTYLLSYAAAHELIHQITGKSIRIIKNSFEKSYLDPNNYLNTLGFQLDLEKAEFMHWIGNFEYTGFHDNTNVNLMNFTPDKIKKGAHLETDKLELHERIPDLIKYLIYDSDVITEGENYKTWLDVQSLYKKYKILSNTWTLKIEKE